MINDWARSLSVVTRDDKQVCNPAGCALRDHHESHEIIIYDLAPICVELSIATASVSVYLVRLCFLSRILQLFSVKQFSP